MFDVFGDNPNEIRPFPPPATPVQFPHFIPATPQSRDARRLERLHERLARLTNSSDIKAEDIAGLNIHFTPDVALEALVPTDSRGQSYLPPPQWDSGMTDHSNEMGQSSRRLYDGEAAPDRTSYLARKAELGLDSDDAYRAIHRKPPKRGGMIANVGNHFKFWNALEMVSRHWDTSLDTEEEIKGKANPPRYSKHGEKTNAMDIDPPEKIESYTGQRIGSGNDMPQAYRESCVKTFVETVAWLFRCQLQSPNIQPRIALGTCLCPVPLSQYVMKTPADRVLARSGGTEGPVAGIFCRSTTQFQDPSSPNGSLAEMIDLLQELLSMLVVAQERYREGKPDIKPGDGKWYTTVPRWGGGSGGEIGNETGGSTDEVLLSKKESFSSSSAAAAEEDKRPAKDPMASVRNYRRTSRASGPQRPKKKESSAEVWKALRPSPSLRDSNVRYQAIGKTKGSGYDDIFLFSALNHHIGIVRLRVCDEYLDFLESGKAPHLVSSSAPSTSSTNDSHENKSPREWDKLEMARSKWYDFFQREDRHEAMRGVWGVMAFLTRSKEQDMDEDENEEKKGKRKVARDKMDTKMEM